MTILKWPSKYLWNRKFNLLIRVKCENCSTKIQIDSPSDLIPWDQKNYGTETFQNFKYKCPYCNRINLLDHENNPKEIERIEEYFDAHNLMSEVRWLGHHLSSPFRLEPVYQYEVLCLAHATGTSYIESDIREDIKEAFDNNDLPREFSNVDFRLWETEKEKRVLFPVPSIPPPSPPKTNTFQPPKVIEINHFTNADNRLVYSMFYSNGICYCYEVDNDGKVLKVSEHTRDEFFKLFAKRGRERWY